MEGRFLSLAVAILLILVPLLAGRRLLAMAPFELTRRTKILRFLAGLIVGFGVFVAVGTFYYEPRKETATAREDEGAHLKVTDLKEGFRLSREQGKPLFVDVWADYCVPCVKFKKNVLSDARVQQKLSGYVQAYVDMGDEKNLWVDDEYAHTQLPWIAAFPSGETGTPAWILNDTESADAFLERLNRYDLVRGSVEAASSTEAPEGQVDGWLASKGLFLTLLLVFLGGILASLTPCAYPTYLLVFSFFAGQNQGKSGLGGRILAASVIILGMVLTFATVGVAAAMGGKAAGRLMVNPWVMSSLGLLFVLIGASSLGVLPAMSFAGVQQALRQKQKQNLAWAFIFGLAMGLVVAPCVGPILSAIVIHIAQHQDVGLGIALMSTFALGMGLLLFALALFSQTIRSRLRMGTWSEIITVVFGILFFAFAFFYAKSALHMEALFQLLFQFSPR